MYGFPAFRGRPIRFALLQAGVLLALSIAANACGRQGDRLRPIGPFRAACGDHHVGVRGGYDAGFGCDT